MSYNRREIMTKAVSKKPGAVHGTQRFWGIAGRDLEKFRLDCGYKGGLCHAVEPAEI